MWNFERNKIGKISEKMEVLDLIEIGIMTFEKSDVFGMAA